MYRKRTVCEAIDYHISAVELCSLWFWYQGQPQYLNMPRYLNTTDFQVMFQKHAKHAGKDN